jgi:hypothetical protein
MHALQKPGRIAGLWFIATFVFSIPAVLLYDPVLNHTDYIFGGGLDARISLGALLEIFTAISNIATAVVFYRVLKRVNQAVALGYVASRTVESTVIVTGLISLMSVVTLRDDFTATGADSASLNIAGHTLVAVHNWTFLLGPQFCAGFGTGLLLGYLMYKSGLVPRRMALLGLIGGSACGRTCSLTGNRMSARTLPGWPASLREQLPAPGGPNPGAGSDLRGYLIRCS